MNAETIKMNQELINFPSPIQIREVLGCKEMSDLKNRTTKKEKGIIAQLLDKERERKKGLLERNKGQSKDLNSISTYNK